MLHVDLTFLIISALCLCSIAFDCDVKGKCVNSEIVGSTLASDSKSCLKYCNENPACNWYSYLAKDEICVALKNCNSLDTSCSECLTGQRECYGNCTTVDGCCQGSSIDYSVAEDVNACQGKCLTSESCNWFTYRAADKICILLKDCSSLTNENEGICSSGEKDCASDQDPCAQNDGCCQGNVLEYTSTASVEACENACEECAGCLWYSFTLESKFCLLLSSCPTLNNPNEGVCTSGTTNCSASFAYDYILVGFGSKDSQGNEMSKSVELLDLKSGKKCQKQPSAKPSYGGIGGMISKSKSMFCGGSGDGNNCQILDGSNTWTTQTAPQMHVSRRFAGFSPFGGDEQILVTGGLNNAEVGVIERSIEVFVDNQWKLLDSTLPDHLYGHCQLKLNSSMLMILGGYGASSDFTGRTWFVEISLDKEALSFTEGPQMIETRFNHACVYDEQAGHVIVAGGYDDSAQKGSEILDLTVSKPAWKSGPTLPEGALHGASLLYQPDLGSVLIGGILINAHVPSKSIWKFGLDKWTKLDYIELTEAKGNFVAFPVSRDFMNC